MVATLGSKILGSVVQMSSFVDVLWARHADNAIRWINRYPLDSVICFVNVYPLDSDLYGG